MAHQIGSTAARQKAAAKRAAAAAEKGQTTVMDQSRRKAATLRATMPKTDTALSALKGMKGQVTQQDAKRIKSKSIFDS